MDLRNVKLSYNKMSKPDYEQIVVTVIDGLKYTYFYYLVDTNKEVIVDSIVMKYLRQAIDQSSSDDLFPNNKPELDRAIEVIFYSDMGEFFIYQPNVI